MCYNVKQTVSLEVLLKRFKASKAVQSTIDFNPAVEVSGFGAPAVRVITHDCPNDIQVFRWGLLPSFADSMKVEGGNLNAKIETLEDKKSFKESLSNRCLILVDGFYEHRWLDPKGRDKVKHLVEAADGKPIAFAGIWRQGIAPNGENVQSCAVVTTEAQGIMREIHNSALRMPVILKPNREREWLELDINTFRSKLDSLVNLDLVAAPMRDFQGSLF